MDCPFNCNCQAAAHKIERLEKALKFYAKARVINPTPGAVWANCDDGEYARMALAGEALP